MEADKRPYYIWIMVLLANIGAVAIVVMLMINSLIRRFMMPKDYLSGLMLLGICIFVTVIPVAISRSNNKLKNYFGYGIPILLLLPIIYFIWHYYTCTGKFCNLGDFAFGLIFGISAVIFAAFYSLDILARKWDTKFVLSLVWAEAILLLGFILYIGFSIFK